MSFWSRTRGGAFARAVSSFSLALVLCLAGSAQFVEMDREVRRAKTLDEAARILEAHRDDPDVAALLATLDEGVSTLSEVRRIVASHAEAERVLRKKPSIPVQERAREIKRSPIYHDPGPAQESNWIARGYSRLREWLQRLLSRSTPAVAPELPNQRPSGQWIVTVAWVILGIGVAVGAFVVARRFSIGALFRKRLRPLLEEDEPERTADEWLAHAATLESEGRFREAVRGLYVACLVRLDEARVARFVRSETNWEHLRRIEANPQAPAGSEFRTATAEFDQIWYGFRPCGKDEVSAFRDHYRRVVERIATPGAAA